MGIVELARAYREAADPADKALRLRALLETLTREAVERLRKQFGKRIPDDEKAQIGLDVAQRVGAFIGAERLEHGKEDVFCQRAAAHAGIDWLRREKRRGGHLSLEDDAVAEVCDTAPDAERLLSHRRELDLLRRILNGEVGTLGQGHRALLVRVYSNAEEIDALAREELGARIGARPALPHELVQARNAVDQRLKRARHAIAKAWLEVLHEPERWP